ncbi:MAG: hypothetical protein F2520_05000 [Actinobacteria bacterium]|uniref:Unannotated protein n=1 Tax=freshwater metagenome TaxID=449393 RepID=A0A6J7IVE9_9ZZZZ|nr:hypothetical protein [Actinomycetota bacterium]MTA77599.1 hypothetical protein [Actinomycetota bacterium]
MTEKSEQPDPIESLLDLLVYAPLGLVTQLDELLPGLIERGRSQAVMARTIGEFAVRAGSEKVQGQAEGAQKQVESILRSLLDLAASRFAAEPVEPADENVATTSSEQVHEESRVLPIEDYETRKAAEIVPMLSSLTPDQRAVIAEHEAATRKRRTILNRIQQLEADGTR